MATLHKNTRHGHTWRNGRSPEYQAWAHMVHRCTNPNSCSYELYGARGITVCERWWVFENFIADMGPRPTPQHSIDRINNDGNYEPANCRWATAREQAANRRVRPALGTRLPTAKMNPAKVRVARRCAQAGLRQTEIAAIFGIDPSCVSEIVRGMTWAHIPHGGPMVGHN